MIKSNLILALRVFRKNGIYSAINIVGLSLSLAAVIIIALYVRYELKADSMHSSVDQIYRVGFHQHKPNELRAAVSSKPLGPTFKRDYPEILDYLRIVTPAQFYGDMIVRHEEKVFFESGILFADTHFFDFFHYDFLHGNPQTALLEPHHMVISEKVSQKFFGNKNPVGEVLQVEGTHNMVISAVVREHRLPSHLNFHYLVPFYGMGGFLEQVFGSLDSYRSNSAYTYVKVTDGFCPDSFTREHSTPYYHNYLFPGIPPENIAHEIEFNFVALRDIYFDHSVYMGMANPDLISRGGNKTYLFVFSTLAIFLIFIAAINYTNMAITQSLGRSKEVGLRKAIGAARHHIASQHIAEAFVFIGVAGFLALFWVELLLPVFNKLMFRDLTFSLMADPFLIIFLLALAGLTALLAASYPAAYLSGVQAMEAFRKGLRVRNGSLNLKSILFTFQFVVSIFLIVVTLFIHAQFTYMQSKDLGFERDNRLSFTLPRSEHINAEWIQSFKAELMQIAGVSNVCSSSGNPLPGNTIPTWGLRVETDDGSEVMLFRMAWTDPDFLETFGIEILDGRNFSYEYLSDFEGKVILNESAAHRIGYQKAIGARLRGSVNEFEVIGICRDFNFFTLEQGIEPMVIVPTLTGREITVVLEDNRYQSQVEEVFNKHLPAHPFSYSFIDVQLEQTLRDEKSRAQLMGLFSLFSILISLSGLFNLVAFSAKKETRQIALRKILGAQLTDIGKMLSRKFLFHILLAVILAIPFAWWYVHNWLENYAYTIQINIWPFLFGVLIIKTVALFALVWHSIRAYKTCTARVLNAE